MEQIYLPEGQKLERMKARGEFYTQSSLERAMMTGETVEGTVTLCDGDLRLHVDLGVAHGILEPQEAVYSLTEEGRKDIAIITRVGKPICAKVLSLEKKGGEWIAHLSRRLSQAACVREYLSSLKPGDLIPARVTHLEPFGAFLDIGCGIPSLLSVDSISVSRIPHPRERLRVGEDLTVAIKSIDRELGRFYTTTRELLGTWEENAALFSVGETVTGVVRSVESYGMFVELTPNLAGLAELRPQDSPAERENMIGKGAAVYIKSILPDRMKLKLVLIDAGMQPPPRKPLREFCFVSGSHLSSWIYSPPNSQKRVFTQFDSLPGSDSIFPPPMR